MPKFSTNRIAFSIILALFTFQLGVVCSGAEFDTATSRTTRCTELLKLSQNQKLSDLFSQWPEDGAHLTADFTSFLNGGISKVIELIPWMTRNGMGRIWTPVFESQAIRKHQYDEDNPRILTFKIIEAERPLLNASKFLTIFGIGFGPCPGLLNRNVDPADTLEFFSYDTRNRSYEFREATFSKNGVQVSEPNQRKCLSCHGQDPRPIVEPYNLWPGWVGSLSRAGADFYINKSPENEIAAKAYKSIQKNPNFSFLEWHDFDTKRPGVINVSHSASVHPNSLISSSVGVGNAERMARMIIEAIERDPIHRVQYLRQYLDEPISRTFFKGPATGKFGNDLKKTEFENELAARDIYIKPIEEQVSREFNAQLQRVLKTNDPYFDPGYYGGPFVPLDVPTLEGHMASHEELTKFKVLCDGLGLPINQLSNSLNQSLNFINADGDYHDYTKDILRTYYDHVSPPSSRISP